MAKEGIKIFILMFCMIFLIGSVSAFEWDNVKSYDQETKTITISNSILKIIPTSEIATIKLNTPIFFKVGAGYRRVAEFKVTSYFDYTDALKSIAFYDKGNNLEEITRGFDYKYKTTEQTQKYKRVCEKVEAENGTINGNCSLVKDGYRNEEVWKPLDKISFLDGEIKTIGIFTDVQRGDYVEWIPTFYGVEIKEWAVWKEDLNTDLIVYYSLNETSNPIIDASGNINATIGAGASTTTGHIGNAIDFDGTNGDVVSDSAIDVGGNAHRTFCSWINPDAVTPNDVIVETGSAGAGNRWSFTLSGGNFRLEVDGGGFTSSIRPTTSAWQFVCLITNGTTIADTWIFKINSTGNYTEKGSGVNSINTVNTALRLGEGINANYDFDGKIDEAGFWNRSLDFDDEIYYMWNGGQGMSWGSGVPPDDPPVVDLILPTDNYVTSNNDLSFSCNATDDAGLKEINLTLNGVVNFTNRTGFYHFDADTDYVVTDPVPSLNFTTGSFSYSFWFKKIGISGFIISNRYGSGGTGRGYSANIDGDNKIRCSIDERNAGGGYRFTDTTKTINDGEWHHLVCVRDTSANKVIVYVDGTEDSRNDVQGFDIGSPQGFYMGSKDSTAGWFNGSLDEVRVYNDTLTSGEVLSLYNQGREEILGSVDLSNLVSYWNLGRNSTLDLIYGNDATNTNSIPTIELSTTLYSLADGNYNWTCEATDSGDNIVNGTARNFTIDTTPFIQFETPTRIDDYNSTSTFIPVNVSLTETYYKNITFTFSDGTSYDFADNTRFINYSFIEGDYDYNVTTCTTTDQCNITETRTINIDLSDPVLSIPYNLTDLTIFTLPTNSTWHFNATDPHLDSCYYNTTDDAAYQVITCNSTQTTNWTTSGSKTIQFCANDTFGFESCDTKAINIYHITSTQFDNPDPIAEGFDATFNLTLNLTSIATTTANFTINGSVYSPTTIQAGTNGYFYEIVLTIPDGWGNTTGFNQSWYWNYTIAGVITDEDTATETITVYALGIDNCSSYGELILNFTLSDEETATAVNQSAGANVEIDLQLTSKTDASVYLNYNHTWTNDNNPQVCIPANVLNNSQYWIDFTVGFDSTDRVWEFYYLDRGTLNSTKVFDSYTEFEIGLMDLLTVDSTSFLFNFFDTDGLPLDSSIVHVFRKYIGEGLFREVERAKADEKGDTIVHLVEEDVIYYFIITDNGDTIYTSSTYTALCQTTPCTIILEASGDSAEFPTDYDLVPDGNFSINSTLSTRTVSLVYNMDTSTSLNFTVYKYESDGSYSSVVTAGETGTSGIITLAVPLSAGNVSFFTTVYIEEEFVVSKWIDFSDRATDYFGTTLSLFLAGLIILTLSLIAVSEGAGVIVFAIIGVLVSGALGLISTSLGTGLSVLIYLILAGGLIIWKLAGGRK